MSISFSVRLKYAAEYKTHDSIVCARSFSPKVPSTSYTNSLFVSHTFPFFLCTAFLHRYNPVALSQLQAPAAC